MQKTTAAQQRDGLEQQQQQESYSSNVDYIDGWIKHQLRKSTTTRASRIKIMVRMAHR
jgi:hypothetical protein